MNPKRTQPLAFTGQSLEKISCLAGINLSNCIGRLYGFTLLALFLFLLCTTWHHVCIDYCKEHIIRKFMVTLQHVLNALLVTTIVGMSLFRPKQFIFPRQEMFIIDSILELYGAWFSKKDIFFAKHLQDTATVSMILLSIMKFVYDSIATESLELLWFYTYNSYSLICLLIIDGLFAHYVNDIYLRFRELNKIAMQHSREKPSICYIDFTTANSAAFDQQKDDMISKIRSIQRIHHGLSVLAIKVNKSFNLQLLIISILCLNGIILYLHDMHYNMKAGSIKSEIIIFQAVFVTCLVLRSLYISYVCQRAKNESRQMAKILHDVFLNYKLLRSEVVHFSLQLIHEDLVFTACGLYEIDIPLMCSILGSVITYLVMVIQLDTTAKFTIGNITQSYKFEINSTDISSIM